MEEPIEKIKEILNIQGQDGCWNYSNYSRGFYNGIQLAFSILVGKEPEYRKKPETGPEPTKE